MKKIISLLIILTLLCSLFGCDEEKEEFAFEIDPETEIGYHELGLYFKLPKEFVRRKVPYAEICFSDGDGYFYYNVYNSQAIVENLGLQANITVEEYIRSYMARNGYGDRMDEYVYDSERNVASFSYIHDYVEEDMESELYIAYVMRGTSHLYVMHFSCYESSIDEYQPMFDELMDIMYAE